MFSSFEASPSAITCWVIYAVVTLLVIARVAVAYFRLLKLYNGLLVLCDAYVSQIDRHSDFLRRPVLYKAITHRYNNVAGVDREECYEVKRKLEKIRKRERYTG